MHKREKSALIGQQYGTGWVSRFVEAVLSRSARAVNRGPALFARACFVEHDAYNICSMQTYSSPLSLGEMLMACRMLTLAAPFLLLVHFVHSATNISASPLSIAPSEFWDGADGFWSTFWIEVGSPPQSLKVIPATSASAGDTTWVIIPEGCTLVDPSLDNCANLRGNVFSYDNSSSWTIDRPGTSTPLANNGTFHLLAIEEGKLGLVGNAYYGFDTIRLGLDGSGLPSVQNQVIAGIATNDFWLGSLGLSPLSFNFTDFSDPLPSLISTLRDEGRIPSISWSYTAGAHYLDPPVFGSLTLGGYDESQFDTTSALRNIPFGADISRDLLVNLEGLMYDSRNGKGSLLSESIYIFIDSLVSQMWLPIDACKQFEDAFSLTWNASAQFYYVSEDTHSTLVSQNPTFTFTFGSGGRTVDISLPYAAFDLELSEPYANGTIRYFPLKPANDTSQNTLGRVFLQEAYLTADYDRNNFTIAQAKHPSTGVEQSLIAITPPGTTTETNSGGGLGAGAIAGIVLGVILTLIIVLGGWLWCVRRRRRSAKIETEARPEEAVHELHEKAAAQDAVVGYEIHGGERYEMGQDERVVELQAGKLAQELDNQECTHELEGTPVR